MPHDPADDAALLGNLLEFKYIFAWLSVCVSIIGILGNLISLVVLSSKELMTTTNIYLLHLCACGIFSLIGLLINSSCYNIINYKNYLAMQDQQNDEHSYVIKDFPFIKIYPYIYAIIATLQMACILFTVAVSVNKFYTIYSMKIYNTKLQYKLDLRRTKFIVCAIYLFSILFCIPYWLKYEYDAHENRLKETKIGSNPLYLKLVHFWLYLPIVYIIPFTILILTNSFLFYTIIKLRQRRLQLFENQRILGGSSIYLKPMASTQSLHINNNDNDDAHNQRSIGNYTCHTVGGYLGVPQRESIKPILQAQSRNSSLTPSNGRSPSDAFTFSPILKPKKIGGMNVTCMLIAVVFLFFFCQLPTLILHILESMQLSSNTTQNNTLVVTGKDYFKVVAQFFLVFNLSFNFACFCLFSTKFWNAFIKLIICKNK